MPISLKPFAMFRTFAEVTPEYLQALGVRAVLADIDNTLAPYEQAVPDERILGWVASLRAAGIELAFISNNDRARVETFNASIGAPAYPKAGKPGGKCIRLAMSDLHVTPAETVFLGDQLLTDALAANFQGIRPLIVPPIKDKTTLFFRFKRLCERPTVRSFKRKHGIEW